MKTRLLLLLALLCVMSGALAPSAPTAAAPPDALPAPIPGATRPTITLSAASGYAGQTLNVSGQGVSGAPGVRVAWLYGDQTLTAAVLSSGAGAYSTAVSVPDDADPGPAKVCAAATGSADAAFACVTFTVTAPPGGTVTGRIPATSAAQRSGTAALNAVFSLLNQNGTVAASAPVASDGSFSLSNVPPGSYQGAVTGTVAQQVIAPLITVAPAGSNSVAFSPVIAALIDPVTGQIPTATSAQATQVIATPSNLNDAFYKPIYAQLAYPPRPKPTTPPADFGSYVTGVALNVTFDARLALTGGTAVDRVEYHVQRIGGSAAPTLLGSATPGNQWQITTNIGQLAAGRYRLIVAPVVGGVRQAFTQKTINVVPDPMKDPKFQPGAVTVWNSTTQRYDFTGQIPNIGGVLPLIYPNPPPSLPLVGTLENKLDLGLQVQGSLDLGGTVRLKLIQARALARVFSQDVYNQQTALLSGERTVGSVTDLSGVGVPFGPSTLWSASLSTTIFKGPLWSFVGLISVSASISVGVDGSLILSGTFRPLEPGLSATLTAQVTPKLSVGVSVDILLALASAGADATAAVTFGLPLNLNTSANPPLSVGDPCFGIKISLAAWVRINILFYKHTWNFSPFDLVDYRTGQCVQTRYSTQQTAPTNLPRLFAAPATASSQDGRLISVYVQDTTPDAIAPTPKLFARFRGPNDSDWGAPVALTDGTHMVQDPVAAFAGPNSTPLVAWSETVMSAAEDDAAGEDLNARLQRQEIYSASLGGTGWSAPQRLTNNALGDGKPTLAGDALGASLAWVRDTGGDVRNRANMRIVTRDWDANTGWGTESVLNGAASGGPAMNVQPSVARLSVTLPGVGLVSRRALAWTVDADSDLNTNADRRVAVSDYDPASGWGPATQLPAPSGGGSEESPSVALDPNTLQPRIALLSRGKDGDGVSDTGVGNQSQLLTASRDSGGSWTLAPLLDAGQPVRAEAPRLTIAAGGERLVLFRRFGQAGTNGALGQLALSQAAASGSYGAPVYLTNSPSQQWQASIAVNSQSNQVMVQKVRRAGLSNVSTSALRPLSGGVVTERAQIVAGGDDPIESLTLDDAAAPALDPALSVGSAAPGGNATVSATLRNLGRGAASNLTVSFYRGAPGGGTLIQAVPVAGPLAFGEQQSISVQVAATGAAQPLYAVVTGSGSSAANNTATGAINPVIPPQLASAAVSPRYLGALEVTWLSVNSASVVGYRVLRATSAAGPYELVGEAVGTRFDDLGVTRGTRYYYVVQGFDANGTRSVSSNQLSAQLPLVRQTLPQVYR